MKRALLIGVPLAVVVVLFVLLQQQQSASNTLTVNENTIDQSSTDDRDGNDAPDDSGQAADFEPSDVVRSELDQPPPPSDAREATLFRALDGDSFEIVWADDGQFGEVRLLGINAPEGDACFGGDARVLLEDLIEDRTILIEDTGLDDFGRVLGNVWVNDQFVNATLVEAGAALALSDGGPHANLITQSLETAQANAAGLWSPSACGLSAAPEVRIADIEYNAPGPDNENKNGEWIEIVNNADTTVDLSGWSIRDESTRHRYFFPERFSLLAGASVRVFSGCGDDLIDELYWCDADPVWNNGGDTGFLVDDNGSFVDTLTYSG